MERGIEGVDAEAQQQREKGQAKDEKQFKKEEREFSHIRATLDAFLTYVDASSA
jgi:hypothetical protein